MYGRSIAVSEVAITTLSKYLGIVLFLNEPGRLSTDSTAIVPVITVRSVSRADDTCAVGRSPLIIITNIALITPHIVPQARLLTKNILSPLPLEIKPDAVISLLISAVTFLKPVQQSGITTAVSNAASIGVTALLPVAISAIAVSENITRDESSAKIQRFMLR